MALFALTRRLTTIALVLPAIMGDRAEERFRIEFLTLPFFADTTKCNHSKSEAVVGSSSDYDLVVTWTRIDLPFELQAASIPVFILVKPEHHHDERVNKMGCCQTK
jgi:hypothetical protein